MDFLAHSFGIWFIFGLLLALWFKKRKRTKSVCIVVLGDIGRSPRMQYHGVSLAKEGFSVQFVGYPGSTPLQFLLEHPKVKFIHLTAPPDLNNRVTRIVAYGIKVIWQSINLLLVLFFKCDSSFLLLQNPPAIPAIPVCWFYCLVTKVVFAIDWHNYAHTIMALSLGANHFLVRLATFLESFFGSKASFNFCVTKAMQEDLSKKWGVKAHLLYDCPSESFQPLPVEEKHKLFLKLSKTHKIFEGIEENSTALTKVSNGGVLFRNDRPVVLVSSTSWTEDEDFSILLDALDSYESVCDSEECGMHPAVICVITGKGPLKEFYKSLIQRRNWNYVTVITPWLENEDYPKLLASADLGVCLHTSSSGLDLPMKVVDMFGCGLPVLAYNFQCLPELVKHNENSMVFSNAAELSEQLQIWFSDFPDNVKQQQKSNQFKNAIEEFRKVDWHVNWSNNVLPCFSSYLSDSN